MFIVFEGIDGSGKTTQALILAETFEFLGIPHILTKEPSDGHIGLKIKSMLQRPAVNEESRFFLEDRLDHVEKVISPALRDGKHVICDRYYYSSAAYQGTRGLNPMLILDQNRSQVVIPDIVLLIEVSVETAIDRIRKSRSDGFSIFEKRKDLEAVATVYETFNDSILKRINGTKSVIEVQREILACLKKVGLEVCST